MTSDQFEASFNEAPRRIIVELPMDLMDDLRAYESVRHEKERDVHIAYARSAVSQIKQGMPIPTAVQYMRKEIPANNFDRHLLIEFINHLLTDAGLTVQFDASLNAYDGDIIISSGDAETALREYELGREEAEEKNYQYFAERYGQLLSGSLPFEIATAFAKADIVSSNMDSARVARCVNAYLEAQGTSLRVGQYLDRLA